MRDRWKQRLQTEKTFYYSGIRDHSTVSGFFVTEWTCAKWSKQGLVHYEEQ